MISDAQLQAFLANPQPLTTTPMQLPLIGNRGEQLVAWQMQFNHLSVNDMYVQYKQLVNKLMFVEMPERQRLQLMAGVSKVAEHLVAVLHLIYQNQLGLLDDKQQRALDTVLSVRYLALMFYHSVWQRAAQQPADEGKTGLGKLLGLKQPSEGELIIHYCAQRMMELFASALFEKHVGYRSDTQVIWRYLNVCYYFAKNQGWKEPPTIKFEQMLPSTLPMTAYYYQCLFAEVANPHRLRRPDILQLQSVLPEWASTMRVTRESTTPPFVFVDLRGDEPPQLLHASMTFNPFDPDESCLFLHFDNTVQRLGQLASYTGDDIESRQQARLAKQVLNGIKQSLTDTAHDSRNAVAKTLQYQAVGGFAQIHYMLANRTSLTNLIQAQLLPEFLRPHVPNHANLNKSTTVNVVTYPNTPHQLGLHYEYSYQPVGVVDDLREVRSVDASLISQLQVNMLIALRQSNQPDTPWYLAQVCCLQQTPSQRNSATPTSELTHIEMSANVKIIGRHLVPCAIRILTDDHRPRHYVAAFIMPNNGDHHHQTTSLLLARFGYQVNDRLMIRIDSKEVMVRLTQLLMLTDDVEEYAFVRIQS